MSDKTTILYIEDDPASRSLVERTLLHAGYRVLVAERGLQGIDMARRERPDLILTDINLPDISGREITVTLRADKHFDNTPIVALTAQAFHEHRAMATVAGVNGYLTKPIDIEALPGQIEFYLKGGSDTVDQSTLTGAQTQLTQEVVGRLERQVRDLEASNANLAQLDRMKDVFIEMTAHELRTPLTLVVGYSRLLQDTPLIKAVMQEDEGMAGMLKGLDDAIRRMQSIVNEIVTINRIITRQVDISIGLVNLPNTIQAVLDSFAEGLKNRRLTIHFDRTGWPERMRGDSELLRLAFANIISNAIKYTPDGGEIFINAESDGQQITLTVQDTGIGIPNAELERIFARFHTMGDVQLHSTSKTAYRGGGLGVGLAVARGIISGHGGTITAQSPGFDVNNPPGSLFTVTLPVTLQYRSRNDNRMRA